MEIIFGNSHLINSSCLANIFREGYIAIVHDVDVSNTDTVHWLVEEENTLNWFRVFWNGGYPGDSEGNTCSDNNCKTLGDGR